MILYLSIPSLANKFNSIALEFGPKKIKLHQNFFFMKLKKMKKSAIKYEKINSEFMLVYYLIAGLHKGCSNDQLGWVRLVKQTIQ
jgi:hypothetical protein